MSLSLKIQILEVHEDIHEALRIVALNYLREEFV